MINLGFRELLLSALKHFAARGYTNEVDLQQWLIKLHVALEHEIPADANTRKELAGVLDRIFTRDVVLGGVQRRVPGVARYTIDRVAPRLRAELDRRIFAGADLIRLNRRATIDKTLQRFSGWVTSVPSGGSNVTNLREVASDIGKATKQLKFERRRVAIDQGHKLSAAVASVVAEGNGAIAAIWHDRGEHDKGYDARPEHLKRSERIFLVRDSWALKEGLVKKSGLSFTDSIEQPAELPYCSCWYEYITSPRALPEALITARGRAWLKGPAPLGPRRVDASPVAVRTTHVHGLEIAIETGKGETRMGVGADGKPWSVKMPAAYGYLKGTLGADGEEVDCYIGPDPDCTDAWVIEQLDLATGEFDEHKVMLGFDSEASALSTYRRGFSDGRGAERMGPVLCMSIDAFKRRILEPAAA
jgi:hypothetical protein